MKLRNAHKIVGGIAIIVMITLIASNFYFYKKSQETDNVVIVLTPEDKERSRTNGPIEVIDDINEIQFALMYADNIEAPEQLDEVPDAIIWFNARHIGVQYLSTSVWFEKDRVIFGIGNAEYPEQMKYKEVLGIRAQGVMECIEKYKIR